jgi:hypothetical protein
MDPLTIVITQTHSQKYKIYKPNYSKPLAIMHKNIMNMATLCLDHKQLLIPRRYMISLVIGYNKYDNVNYSRNTDNIIIYRGHKLLAISTIS